MDWELICLPASGIVAMNSLEIKRVTPRILRAKANERAAKALDEIEANVAVLDQHGCIVITNKAWRDFALANPLEGGRPPQHVEVGTNYLDICRRAAGQWSENALLVHHGIRAVLDGERRNFIHEYPCDSPDKQRWFEMKVKPLRRTKPKEVVVIHVDITERRYAELESLARQRELGTALVQLQAMAERIKHSVADDHAFPPANAVAPGDLLRSGSYQPQARSAMLKKLSKRELEVLLALARGERNSDIASRLQLSKKSVSTYRSRVLEKLKAENNAELVAFAAKAELLQAERMRS